MNDLSFSKQKGVAAIPMILGIVAVVGLGILFFQLNSVQNAFSGAVEKYNDANTKLSLKEEEARALSEALYSEQQKNAELEDELDDVEDELDDLEKLSKIDSELLQKYSKVYFLNEHYTPASVIEIDKDLRYPEDKELSINKRVAPFLEGLLRKAKEDKVDLRVASAYRSFDEQSTLKSGYSVTYGAGSANAFSADQGYSEHQLGTTVDFTTVATKGALDGFNSTASYTWLLANAYKYGFVLSYPEGNAYYVFEPWHWRFVGKDLAEDLRKKKIGFYDMDQRDIDKYLIKFFDK
ncbi:MAG: zinc D-Ala-D-Ala carboxypeptidase [Patescibacteria group bacterium]|jgi:LAS superfamily LD-carboxypeptidase LdcB|nr:zinc D-Ala-D-Ala carboxypeptidase [Patescibacteria group bacterium]